VTLRGGIGQRLCIFLLACSACGSSDKTSGSSGAVTATGSGSAQCDMTPINAQGDLPACAAGVPSESGPGLPYNFTGSLVGSMALDASGLAAEAAANALSAARNPATQDPVDRGFAPAPVAKATKTAVLP
jgi:hypothetical protein